MSLTLLGIVNLALDQAGLDSSFQTKARGWYNFAANKLSFEQNYNFYRKHVDVPFVVGQSVYTLPADFQRADTMYYIASTGQQGRIISIVDAYGFDLRRTIGQGFPNFAFVNEESGNIEMNCAPDTVSGEQYRFFYFRKPAVLKTDGTDDAIVPDFKDQSTLVEELIRMGYTFLDDQREQTQEQKSEKSSMKYQRLVNQTGGNSRMDLNSEVFRPLRRGRNRQYRGF